MVSAHSFLPGWQGPPTFVPAGQTGTSLVHPSKIAVIVVVVVVDVVVAWGSAGICNVCTGHSTKTVLLRIVDDILSALDNDNISVGSFICFSIVLDFFAAFDTTDHQILARSPVHVTQTKFLT